MAAPSKIEEIRRIYNKDNLFVDPEFPTVDRSLFFSKKPPRPFEWKRPHELCSDPKLFVGGASRFDINQGMLGNCWFLAAVAGLSLDEHLLQQVLPPGQDFESNYCGAFYFRFWRSGQWKEVVIDDLLPTYNGRLVFVHSKEKNEFWSALLEKAYAKLHHSYEALKGGQTGEAMEDFTGGLAESYNTQKAPENFFKIMSEAYQKDSQIACSIAAKPNEIEAKLDNGLVKGHAYTVTDVKPVTARTRSGPLQLNLVRVRNPWGNEREWNGAWSDGSREWSLLSDSEKSDLGLTYDDDGEFWMTYKDFISNFTTVEICHLSPDRAQGYDMKNKKWVVNAMDGRWQKHMSAGGCRNFPDTFADNPQFVLKLEELDDEEGCTVIVGLMQKNRRKMKMLGESMLTIGFAIYNIPEDFRQENESNAVNRLPKDFFLYHASTARSPSFINSREVVGRFKLPPGRYCVVPSTFNPNEQGDFLLRTYSLKALTSETLDEKTAIVDVPQQPETKSPDIEDSMRERFRALFEEISGVDMEVDAWELQDVLNTGMKKDLDGTDGFSVETCKVLIASRDTDRSGKLGFEEFLQVWMDIRKWRNIFAKYDKDRSGNFNSFELRGALRELGYSVSDKILSALILRFANKQGRIDIDDFISCIVKLKNLHNSFKELLSRGAANLDLDEFIAVGIYS